MFCYKKKAMRFINGVDYVQLQCVKISTKIRNLTNFEHFYSNQFSAMIGCTRNVYFFFVRETKRRLERNSPQRECLHITCIVPNSASFIHGERIHILCMLPINILTITLCLTYDIIMQSHRNRKMKTK